MTAGGFPGALGVVRIQLGRDRWVAMAPTTVGEARRCAQQLVTKLGRAGDSSQLIPVKSADAIDCWVRAREVLSVEVVPTEDPGLGS